MKDNKGRILGTKRNLSIDLIKVIAMFMVMTLHTPIASAGKGRLIAVCVYLSGIAIPLFFMVSGWLMINKEGDCHYSFRKIGAILKFILLVTIIGYGVEVAICRNWSFFGFIKAIKAPFFQEGLFSVFWYLVAMISVYLLFPIIKKIDNKYGLKGLVVLWLFCLIIESFIFPCNIIYQFERKYVLQPYRIWNWIFYYLTGSLIRRNILPNVKINWILPVFLGFVYVVFCYGIMPVIHAWEYLYSSPLCWLYAVSVFLYIAGLNINNEIIIKIVKWLSKLFLPVYALHIVIIVNIMSKIPRLSGALGIVESLFVLIGVWITTIGVSWAVMKIPVINKIFKL